MQNAIRQRIKKYFEKSCKKIWKQCYIVYIFASLNIGKHYESIRICKENGRPPLNGKAVDKRGQGDGDKDTDKAVCFGSRLIRGRTKKNND